MVDIHPGIQAVTERIIERSRESRQQYLARILAADGPQANRCGLSCTNLAHAFAAAPAEDKSKLSENRAFNIGIVSAYNDMLSAHQPFEAYPKIIKQAARAQGGVAQFAGGVPAMCDGVTQGQPGMELSLFSRDVIAMGTAVALSHEMFDAVLCLGVCDKIVPGLLIGALSYGHLPVIFVPAGPMTSGLPNPEKARIRQLFAEGKIDRQELLAAESKSYHGPGTCTFYGTANSNQMLMEFMGLHLPGAAFVNPGTSLREALTVAATERALKITHQSEAYTPIGRVIDERAIVNAMVGLHATGGSTNHTMHLVVIAAAAGIKINWDDFAALSQLTPQLTRIYPNGVADVNQFHAAGGLGLVISELLDNGFLHPNVLTVSGGDLGAYRQEPKLVAGALQWQDSPRESLDKDIIGTVKSPMQAAGGLRVLEGNLGRAIMKTSAVKIEHQIVEAPAIVFDSQDAFLEAFKNRELEKDFIAVVRFQGPTANGMPELHKLTPALGVLQDKGFKVALLTDGRMSGASGKVPAAVHVTPEANQGGLLAKLNAGDLICIDGVNGLLNVHLSAEALAARNPVASAPIASLNPAHQLFRSFRNSVSGAESGASIF